MGADECSLCRESDNAVHCLLLSSLWYDHCTLVDGVEAEVKVSDHLHDNAWQPSTTLAAGQRICSHGSRRKSGRQEEMMIRRFAWSHCTARLLSASHDRPARQKMRKRRRPSLTEPPSASQG